MSKSDDGVEETREVQVEHLDITPKQAKMLTDLSNRLQAVQSQLQAMVTGILAGFEDVPDGAETVRVNQDPPQITVRYQEPEPDSDD